MRKALLIACVLALPLSAFAESITVERQSAAAPALDSFGGQPPENEKKTIAADGNGPVTVTVVSTSDGHDSRTVITREGGSANATATANGDQVRVVVGAPPAANRMSLAPGAL